MKLEIVLKAGTTLVQAEKLFDELTDNEEWVNLIENIRLQPGEKKS